MNDKSFDEIIEYLFVGSKNALNDKANFYLIVNCTLELCKDSVNLYIDDVYDMIFRSVQHVICIFKTKRDK